MTLEAASQPSLSDITLSRSSTDSEKNDGYYHSYQSQDSIELHKDEVSTEVKLETASLLKEADGDSILTKGQGQVLESEDRDLPLTAASNTAIVKCNILSTDDEKQQRPLALPSEILINDNIIIDTEKSDSFVESDRHVSPVTSIFHDGNHHHEHEHQSLVSSLSYVGIVNYEDLFRNLVWT